MIDITWILLTSLTYVISLETNVCNRTIDINDYDDHVPKNRVTFKYNANNSQAVSGFPYSCWYRLHANDMQYVVVYVSALDAGEYEEKQCRRGYLRISEEDEKSDPDAAHKLPPTTLCGHDPIRVKRLTRGPSAFVEFHVDKSDKSQNYEFDAIFMDKEPQDKLPYGHIQRTDGRINSSFCDWLVPVETCMASCRLVSPGYPGIYPPNTVCKYSLINFEDGRVQVKFGSKSRGKFDLKKSEDCSEDYMLVYDGSSNKNRLIGRYCGLDNGILISSTSHMYIELHTQSGGPPYEYSGFDMEVIERWKNEHDFGSKHPDSLCDWSFQSYDSDSGDVHTPDHMIDPGTTCLYTFTGQPGEVLELSIKSYVLKPDCRESIEVMDGDTLLDRICADNLGTERKFRRIGTPFQYTTKHHQATVRYSTMDRHSSNFQPNWISYTFINSTEEPELSEEVKLTDSDIVDVSDTTSGTSTSRGIMTTPDVMIVLAVVFRVLCWSS